MENTNVIEVAYGQGRGYEWTPEESEAVVSTVDMFIAENPTFRKRQIFEMAYSFYCSLGFSLKRTPVAFKNHYYYLKRTEADLASAAEETVEETAPLSKDETQELVGYINGIVTKYEEMRNNNRELLGDNIRLTAEHAQMKHELEQMKADYNSLLKVIERARKITVDEEVPLSHEHSKFIMERNGNLVPAAV
jgi:hypothetical protein